MFRYVRFEAGFDPVRADVIADPEDDAPAGQVKGERSYLDMTVQDEHDAAQRWPRAGIADGRCFGEPILCGAGEERVAHRVRGEEWQLQADDEQRHGE